MHIFIRRLAGTCLGALVLGTALSAFAATADGEKVGGEVMVNTSTTYTQRDPAVARDANGGFVVVWADDAVRAQLFNANGARRGAEIIVQQGFVCGTSEAHPEVAMRANGEFVVVWCNDGDGESSGIFGQRYSAAGEPAGQRFLANAYIPGMQSEPDVAYAADGSFVVTWDAAPGTVPEPGISARVFAADGTPVTGDIAVNTEIYSFGAGDPHIAVAPSGDFVVVFVGEPLSPDRETEVYMRRFEADGTGIGTESVVNGYQRLRQDEPEIAMDPLGNFTVAWNGFYNLAPPEAQPYEIVTNAKRQYAADGTPGVESPMTPGLTASDFPSRPRIAMNRNGGLVAVYHDSFSGSNQSEIIVRRYDASGAPVGSMQVNTTTVNSQVDPVVAVDGDGDAIVAWRSYTPDGSDSDVYMQRLAGPEPVDVGVGLIVSPLNPTHGGDISITADVFNYHAAGAPGVGVATGVELGGETFAEVTSIEAPDWTCGELDGVPHCVYEKPLLPRTHAKVTFKGRVRDDGAEYVQANAWIDSDQVDPRTENNGVTTMVDIGPPDTKADAFGFRRKQGLPTGIPVRSEFVTIRGINIGTPIKVAVGTGDVAFRINGAEEFVREGIVHNGDTVQLKLISSRSANSLKSAKIQIGDDANAVFGVWRTETGAVDQSPDSLEFLPVSNAPLRTLVQSNEVTLAGVNAPVEFKIVQGPATAALRVNGGTFSTSRTPVTVNAGDLLQLQVKSLGAPGRKVRVLVQAGTTLRYWVVTTSP